MDRYTRKVLAMGDTPHTPQDDGRNTGSGANISSREVHTRKPRHNGKPPAVALDDQSLAAMFAMAGIRILAAPAVKGAASEGTEKKTAKKAPAKTTVAAKSTASTGTRR
jgi:hypothetical protein